MKTPKRTSDEAVKAATGKTWPEWFAVLDKAGSTHREHTAIARWLADVEKVPPWWSQMVTVEYERARGLRKVHETATGFEVSVHKTFAVPLHELYVAWADEKKRAKWLCRSAGTSEVTGSRTSEVFTDQAWNFITSMQLTSTRLDKILHFKLADGSKIDVATDLSPSGKARLGLSHTKLKKASDVEKQRTFWKAALERLAKELGDAR